MSVKVLAHQMGMGFKAVPYAAVGENKMQMFQTDIYKEPYDGPWAIIAPNGYAVEGAAYEPYKYANLASVRASVARFLGWGMCSTCGGVWRASEDMIGPKLLTDHDWCQIEQAASGCISGTSDEWPDLVAAINKLRGQPLGLRKSADWLRGFCEALITLRSGEYE